MTSYPHTRGEPCDCSACMEIEQERRYYEDDAWPGPCGRCEHPMSRHVKGESGLECDCGCSAWKPTVTGRALDDAFDQAEAHGFDQGLAYARSLHRESLLRIKAAIWEASHGGTRPTTVLIALKAEIERLDEVER